MARGRAQEPVQEGCGTGFDAIHWLNIEPCGLICAGLSWFIVLYCQYAMTVGALCLMHDYGCIGL